MRSACGVHGVWLMQVSLCRGGVCVHSGVFVCKSFNGEECVCGVCMRICVCWGCGWMGGWVDGWEDGWMNGWMGRWVDGWIDRCVGR